MQNDTPQTGSQERSATILGIIAIVLWASSVPVARRMTEILGVFTSAAASYTMAGVVTLALCARSWRAMLGLAKTYLVICGALVFAYVLFLYLALGWAADRTQVVEIAVINYLWPSLTIVLSIPILKRRASWWLAPGLLLSTLGAALAVSGEQGLSAPAFVANLSRNPWTYAAALAAACAWALYSNLSRRLGGSAKASGMPLFLLATGLGMLAIRLGCPETPVWTARAVAELVYVGVFSSGIAYLFWDIAMRRGHMTAAVILSYFTPVLSAIMICLYLGVRPCAALWVACGLVMAGAALCKLALRDRA